MAERTFGAVKGAGVQVREVGAAQPISQGPFGTTAIVGPFRSGPADKAIRCEGQPDYERIFGRPLRSSFAALAAAHFWTLSQGAAPLIVQRVTAGDEVAASARLWNRSVHRSVLERSPTAKIPGRVLTVAAANGGAWGGRAGVRVGDVTLGSAITVPSTIDLGISTQTDRWVGALLSFPGDAPGQTFRVVENSAAGVFIVDGPFPVEVTGGSDGRWILRASNANEIDARPEYAAVEVADGGEDPGTEVSLFGWRDGLQAGAWEDQSIDEEAGSYLVQTVNEDSANFLLALTDTRTGAASDPLERAANYAEIPAPGGIASNTVRLQTVRWELDSAGNPYLDTVADFEHGADAVPCTLVLTFADATTAAVVATLEDGATVALGTLTLDAEFVPPWSIFPTLTVREGDSSASAADTMTIYVRPLPSNLASRGGLLYAAAAPSEGNVRTFWRIVSNTADTITVPPGIDLSAALTAPTAPAVTGSIAGPYDMTGSLTYIYRVGKNGVWSGPYTLTETLSSGSKTAAQVAAELNVLELARAGSAADKLVEFSVESNRIVVRALQDFGSEAEIRTGNGTINSVLGFTDGTRTPGVDGKIVRLQYRQELEGGYDGAEVDGADYERLLDPVTGPICDLLPTNTGLIKIATPGAPVAGQRAALRWAYAHNGAAYLEIPAAVITEAAAVAYHAAEYAIGDEADYGPCHWPSWGKIPNPWGTGLYSAPVTGAVLGIEARRAVDLSGYHNAPAGAAYSISAIFRDLATGARRLNNELLNSYGLIEMRRVGAAIYAFGDRIPGSQGRVWKHARLARSHIGRVLLTNTGSLVWSRIDEATFKRATVLVRELFAPWFAAGWFDDAAGPGFDNAVSIKCDATNNPPSSRAAGDLHVDIAFGIVGTAERVIFTVGPRAVNEQG